MSQKTKNPQPTPIPATLRSELNLEKSRIFTVSSYPEKSREIVINESTDIGTVIERRIIVGRTAEGYETGILTANHFKVYLALLQLWEKAGKPTDKRIPFTIWYIIQQCGMANSGKNYEIIKRYLMSLRQIDITFIDSFFLTKAKTYTTLRPFNILNYLEIHELRGPSGPNKGFGEFRFDDHIVESLINNYTHPLRFDVITGFKKYKEVSILLYVYLDRCLALTNTYEIGLDKLFDYLDLSQRQIRYPSDRKAKLTSVIKQLEGKELSTGILSSIKITRTKKRDYKLVCRKIPYGKQIQGQLGQDIPDRSTEPPQEQAQTQKQDLLVSLTSRAVSNRQASRLVRDHSDWIKRGIDLWELEKKKNPDGMKNPAGYLVSIIKAGEDWQPPDDYVSPEEKKQRQEKKRRGELVEELVSLTDDNTPPSPLLMKSEKDPTIEEFEQEVARIRDEKEKREQDRKARIEQVLEGLSDQEREEIREEALSRADSFLHSFQTFKELSQQDIRDWQGSGPVVSPLICKRDEIIRERYPKQT